MDKIRKFTFNRKYLGIAAYATGSIVVSAVIIIILINLDTVMSHVQSAAAVFMPIIAGLFIAYLLNPMLKFFERNITDPLFGVQPLIIPGKHKQRTFKKPLISYGQPEYKARKGKSRAVSLIATILIVFIAFGIIIALVIPQLVENIITIFANSDAYINEAKSIINNIFEDNPTIAEFLGNPINDFGKLLSDFWGTYQQELVGFAGNLATGIWSIIDALKNVIIGLIIGIYLLYSKELFTAQFKKIMFAVCPRRTCRNAIKFYREADTIFLNSIIGRIIDAFIVGVICFLGCTIMGLPYALLFSVIIFVFNLIPFFGAFIGCIPCVLLLLLSDTPINALWFVIFVIILQNIDGNIISPRIIGEKTGLPAIWVLLSILIGGGFFGILGMLLGVPVCAVIYMLIKNSVSKRLDKKKLPTSTMAYSGTRTEAYDEQFRYIKRRVHPKLPIVLKTVPYPSRTKLTPQLCRAKKGLFAILKKNPPIRYQPPAPKGIAAFFVRVKRNFVELTKPDDE